MPTSVPAVLLFQGFKLLFLKFAHAAIENDSCHYRTFSPFTSLENIAHRLGSYKSRDENKEIQFCLVDRVVSWADPAITGSASHFLFLTSSSGSDDFRNTHTSGLNCEPTANQI